jgi:alpha-tubulin suppressor-like RCC1 family protein
MLALLDDGTVRAWGCDNLGQATLPASLTSTAPPEERKVVTAIAAGAYHSLALCSDGSVVGFGDNSQGQVDAVMGTYDDATLVDASFNTTVVYRLSNKTIFYFGPKVDTFPYAPSELVAPSVLYVPEVRPMAIVCECKGVVVENCLEIVHVNAQAVYAISVRVHRKCMSRACE